MERNEQKRKKRAAEISLFLSFCTFHVTSTKKYDKNGAKTKELEVERRGEGKTSRIKSCHIAHYPIVD